MMVLLASAFDQSRFFKAEDFELGEDKKLKIKMGTEELIGVGADQKKMLTVWFTNSEKGLLLNRTNNRTLRNAFGDPVAGWVGRSSSSFVPRPNSGVAWFRPCGFGFHRQSKQRPATVSPWLRSLQQQLKNS